ncbi:hypothetical protein V6N13_016729 [Hibiscus sabdariffa]
MGGCKFLIDIKDQELNSNLQLQEWAVLKEVFSEVEAWTEHKGRINEVTEVEVGRDCFLVQVDELGLNFHPKQSDVPLQSKAKKSVEYSSESSSDPSSVPVHCTTQTNESRL